MEQLVLHSGEFAVAPVTALGNKAPSSSGLGSQILNLGTWVQVPLGSFLDKL